MSVWYKVGGKVTYIHTFCFLAWGAPIFFLRVAKNPGFRVYMSVYMYIYIHTHIYIHTYIHGGKVTIKHGCEKRSLLTLKSDLF